MVKRNVLILGIAIFAVAGALLAQDPPAKTRSKKASSHEAAAPWCMARKSSKRKRSVPSRDSDAKKIGPGLKGISKRGTFTVNG